MLDDFKDSQFVAYSLLTNAIKNDKLSHAYLIDANKFEKSFDFVLSFVKSILCKSHYVNSDNCYNCNLCQRIQSNNYPELKIIESTGSVIKKEQLLELQNDFSLSSIEGKYRIYIIKDCDKMNKQASNCLLKFLEEPVSGVIAILLTNNFSKLLSTIISRCQIIRLTNDLSLNYSNALENLASIKTYDEISFKSFVDDERNSNLLIYVLEFLNYIEENGVDALIYIKDLWYGKFLSREDYGIAFLLMTYFYYDVLKFKLSSNSYFFCDRIEDVEKISKLNSIDSLLNKIEIVSYGYEMINYNLNINLLLDDIVIRLGDVNEYS